MNDNDEKLSTAAPPGELTVLKLAMFFVVLSMLLQAGAVAYGNHADHAALQNALANQEPAVEEIERARKQLNAIAGKTLALAQKGNANAARIVEQLQAAGVNLTTSDGSPTGNP